MLPQDGNQLTTNYFQFNLTFSLLKVGTDNFYMDSS